MLRIKDGFTGQLQIVLPPIVVDLEKKDPLLRNLYITDIGFYPHAEGHYRTRPHAITEHVIIYCVRGKGHYTIGERTFDVSPNQYFVLPPNIAHTYWADEEDPWTIYWIHYSGELAPYYERPINEGPGNINPSPSSHIQDRNHLFEEIFFTLSDSHAIENLRYASSLLYYYLASMHFLSFYRREIPNSRTDSMAVVPAVLHYMQENLGARLSLQSVAQYMGYSISHLSKLFREQTGMSPLFYFNNLKIEEARHLLRTSNLSITQISHSLGIDDAYYFSRLFHKQVGCSPSEYRTQKHETQ